MAGRSTRTVGAGVALLALALGGAACAPRHEIPASLARMESSAEESAPLGGPALRQRREQLQRMHRDLIQIQTSIASLRHRGDRLGMNQLTRFVDAYMGLHLEPVLRPQWQSRHPELMALDANLRFLQADVLLRMRANARAKRVMGELAERFEGRGDMLVDYPIGEQNTLADAFLMLREGGRRRPL